MFGAVNRVRARSLGAAIDSRQRNRASKMERRQATIWADVSLPLHELVWSSSPTKRVVSDLQSSAAARAPTTTASPEDSGSSRRCLDEFKRPGSAACAVSDGTLLSIQKGQGQTRASSPSSTSVVTARSSYERRATFGHRKAASLELRGRSPKPLLERLTVRVWANEPVSLINPQGPGSKLLGQASSPPHTDRCEQTPAATIGQASSGERPILDSRL